MTSKAAVSSRLNHFFQSKLYILLVMVCIFLGNTTSTELFFAFCVLGCVVCACFVCHDLRFLLPPLCGMVCSIPLAHTPYVPTESGFYTSTSVLILFAVGVLLLLAGLTVFVLRNRKSVALPRVSLRSLFLGFCAFAAALLLSGAFHPQNDMKNFAYALGIAASFLVFYIFIALFHPRTKENAEHFLFTMAALGVCVVAELIVLYITKVEFDGFFPVKNSIMIGWGTWTHIGALLTVSLPCALYFAHSGKRWLPSLLTAALLFIGIFMTASRGAWLYGGILLLVCLIYLSFSGENKKKTRLLLLIALGFALVLALLLAGKIYDFLLSFLQVGFSDNGRFELWHNALRTFAAYPIFGVGFFNTGIVLGGFPALLPYLYHNTVLQMMASCGLIGCLLYLFHRAQTVALAIRKRHSSLCIFLLLSAAALVLVSLTDEHLFHIYPAFWYTAALYLAEGDYE